MRKRNVPLAEMSISDPDPSITTPSLLLAPAPFLHHHHLTYHPNILTSGQYEFHIFWKHWFLDYHWWMGYLGTRHRLDKSGDAAETQTRPVRHSSVLSTQSFSKVKLPSLSNPIIVFMAFLSE